MAWFLNMDTYLFLSHIAQRVEAVREQSTNLDFLPGNGYMDWSKLQNKKPHSFYFQLKMW